MVTAGGMCAQVLTSSEEFAAVRDRILEMGLEVDHDSSGLIFAPLTSVEVLLPNLLTTLTLKGVRGFTA